MTPAADERREALEAIASGAVVPVMRKEEDGWHARWRMAGDPAAKNPKIDKYMREATMSPLSENAENQFHDTLHDAWLAALRSRTGLVRGDEAECEALAAALDERAAECEFDADAMAAMRFGVAQDGDALALECDMPALRSEWRALGQALVALRDAGAPAAARKATGGERSILLDIPSGSFTAAARVLQASGFKLEIPDAFRARVDVEAKLSPTGDATGPEPREAGMSIGIRIAEEPATAAEIKFLLDQGGSMVFFHNRWIEIDRDVLREALRLLDKNAGKKLSGMEAFAFASGLRTGGTVETKATGWLLELVERMKRAKEPCLEKPAGLEWLLPYQSRGVAWMAFLAKNGFGALLADDMGLGKTAQAIAFLRTAGATRPALVVAPLGLLANWRREFARFAPQARIYVHQGDARLASPAAFAKAAGESDAVLASYSLLAKDFEAIGAVKWKAVVLDEAQTIKNSTTKTAAAATALTAEKRIALTGTPVENSVEDLWSIENFLNPGLLGPLKDFRERFAKPIAAEPGGKAAQRLAAAIEPVILRRLKTDPEVAAELGAKRIVREFCALSPLQRAQYESALAAYGAGNRTKGDVFALIVKLKQICDGEGKIELLCSTLQSIFDAGESALVFTQFAKTGETLRRILEKRFGRSFPFLHGELSPAEREREIEAFSGLPGPSAFILSLKAGGFGLNLVKATHVIHFDRWWNPAVEAQATDRAHRIGQERNVLSHLFITEGTLEERIDALLEKKSRVAGKIVVSGESFLRSLAPEEFDDIVRLDKRARG